MTGQNEDFQEWIRYTLGLGFDAYKDHARIDSIFLKDVSGEMHTLVMDLKESDFDQESYLNEAHDIVGQFPQVDYYAIVWIGRVTSTDGKEADAVLVEAGERGGSAGVSARLFQRDTSGAVLATDEVIQLAEVDNAISDFSGESEEGSDLAQQPLTMLVSAVIPAALKRLENQNQTPFMCLAHANEGSFAIIDPESPDGESDSLIESLREAVTTNDRAQAYAIAYIGAAEFDGVDVNGLVIEAGDRNGSAPIYFLRYKTSETGEIQPADNLDMLIETGNLWADDGESGDDDVDDDQESDDTDEVVSPLDDLVEQVFSLAVERLQAGNEIPCACLAQSDQEEISILDPGAQDADTDDILDALRTHIASVKGSDLYAILYFGQIQVDDQGVDAIIVEAGDREGEAPVFGLTYKLSKAGKVKVNEIEYLDESNNLWGKAEA